MQADEVRPVAAGCRAYHGLSPVETAADGRPVNLVQARTVVSDGHHLLVPFRERVGDGRSQTLAERRPVLHSLRRVDNRESAIPQHGTRLVAEGSDDFAAFGAVVSKNTLRLPFSMRRVTEEQEDGMGGRSVDSGRSSKTWQTREALVSAPCSASPRNA